MTFRFFGQPARAGRLVRRSPAGRLEAAVERTPRGWLIKGAVSGRPGRVLAAKTTALILGIDLDYIVPADRNAWWEGTR